MAVGAAVENLKIAASAAGLRVSVREAGLLATNGPCRLAFERTKPEISPLFDQIHLRCTNRRHGEPTPLSALQEVELRAAAGRAPVEFVRDSARLQALGEAVGKGELFRFFQEPLYRELMAEIRWTKAEVEATRDGIDAASLELDPAAMMVMRLLASRPVVERLRDIGGGGRLIAATAELVSTSAALGLSGLETNGQTDYFELGRAMQRLWLQATALGLSVQPMTALPFSFPSASIGSGELYARCRARARGDPRSLPRCGLGTDASDERFLFRLTSAKEPTVRALRRPLNEILTLAPTWRAKGGTLPPRTSRH